MKVGTKRIDLAKILTELTGSAYSPSNIKQANGTVGDRSRSGHDPHYWYALPDRYGGVIASRHTMAEIIEAYHNGERVSLDWSGQLNIERSLG